MIAASADFVCAADEVWRLQRGSEADCVLFQRMVNGGERITDRGTRQGTWVLAPGGAVLARTNTRDASAVLRSLAQDLAAYRALPAEARRLSAHVDLAGVHRWEHSRPADGLVLERIGRELRSFDPGAERHPSWNRDYAWFSRGEVAAALGEGPLEPGRVLEWDTIARRLARFHLVDNVRGQTIPYAAEEVERAELTARVTAADGPRVELMLAGRTRAVAEGPWLMGDNLWTPRGEHPHGIECVLAGRATYDRAAGAFASFELVALGARWGRTDMNGRGRDGAERPGPVAFHLALAPDPSATVAPAFVALYDADWIARPDVPTWRDSPAEVGLAR